MFISVDGKSKKVTDIFAGGTDGKAHRITELFGSVDGVAKQLYTVEKTATNAFDQFTWAEIKQLANEGKLLEHFRLYDRVTVKLKQSLESELNFYMTGYGIYEKVPQVQSEMVLQIIELTETKMRLMSPRVTALGGANSSLTINPSSLTPDDKWYYYASDFYNNTSNARNYVSYAWGLTPMYDALKTIQNALPDDLVEVLSVCTRPMISYTHHAISEATITKFDDDMRVRQISDNVLSKSIDMSQDDIFYPIIHLSYYPTSVGDYLYYIRVPDKYDTYTQRKYLVKNYFRGVSFMDHKKKGDYILRSYSYAPYVSCYFRKGITTNDDYESYRDNGEVVNGYQSSGYSCNTVIPEMIIEADL